ncbi:MAG: CoA transferase, partial [SAR202 cluster bacterium]|nr:CoA transferase [SAR202 cluster bacterium]
SKILRLPESILSQNLAERKSNRDELDLLISKWTSQYDSRYIMNLLQSHKIPSGMVQSQSDMWEDPHLDHLDFFQWLEHTEIGPMPYDGLQFQLSETPGKLTRAQAMVGEDNKEILTEILSMRSSEVQTLLSEGVLEQSF